MHEPSTRWRDRIAELAPGVGVARLLAVAVPALALATALVWLLEERFGVMNASPVYILAVVVTALLAGTVGALAAAIAGILIYNYFFVDPIHTFTISDPGDWLNLILLLFVGLVVGQLTALERARALTAEAREREVRELFLVSRSLATRASTTAVLQEIADHVRRAAHMASVWISLGPDDGGERIAALAGEPPPPRTAVLHWVLRRMPGDEPATWVRIHTGSGPGLRRREPDREGASGDRLATYRVRIEVGVRSLGSIWSTRPPRSGHPDRSATRLVSAAADQIGQALAQDQLASDVRAAEVARQSDALKSALLQSVSHDLRSPLATIRAAAGTLRPDSDLDAAGRLASADAIEREVRRLDRLVANLLDLGRIEAGALRAEVDVFELDDLAGRIVDRMANQLAGRDVRIELDSSPVLVDPVFLDEALTNLLDNALKFAGPGSTIRVASSTPEADVAGDHVRLVVEDGGPGVPDELLDRVFEPFFKGPATGRDVRVGTGIGLAVVRGLIEAMGGGVRAGRSELGGLAVTLDLPRASLPAELVANPSNMTTGGATVLVVEDDSETRAVLVRELGSRGYRTQEAPDGRSALDRWGASRPDLVLLDLGLPDMDGLEVIRRIRREAMTPIVILSGRYAEREKVEALDRGADDFVTKPFGLDELHARIRVALRRAAGPGGDADGRIIVGPLVFDAGSHEARVGDQRIDLTPREFEILRVLLGEQGRIVTKGKLLRAVWGQAYQGEDSYVYVHVSQLRHKLAAADSSGALRDLIVTEPGVGYRVREPEARAQT